MKSLLSVALFFGVIASSSGFASGFTCTSHEGYKVKLYNQVDPHEGTRNPATFVLSDENGTVLVRHDSEITKKNYANSTSYIVDGPNISAHTVVFSVQYKEGIDEKLEIKNVAGRLIFVGDEGRSSVALVCKRYLKGKPETF